MTALATLILVIAILAAAAFWAANALWVSIISKRWEAMCNEHPPARLDPGTIPVAVPTAMADAGSREQP